MYQVLIVLFYVANILSLAIFFSAFCLTLASKKLDGHSKLKIELPVFAELATYARHCFWTGTGFIIIDWLLCSSSAIVTGGKPRDVFSEILTTFATVWAIMIFVSIIIEITLKFIRRKSDAVYSVSSAIPSIIWYAILYFILSFLIG